MRRVVGLNIAGLVAAQITRPERELDPVTAAHVNLSGASAAGWLVFKHRKPLHRQGFVSFDIPDEAITPPWFRVAIEMLRRRQGWSVIVSSRMGRRRYYVRWHRWNEIRRAS